MTTMSRPFSRPAIIPVSLLVLGLFMLSGSPTTFATGLVLFLIGGVVLTIMLFLWKARPPTTVAMRTPAPPNAWPNSVFRNASRRRTSF
jgi:hypothetical protein